MTDEQTGRPVKWDSIRFIDAFEEAPPQVKNFEGIPVMKLNLPPEVGAELPNTSFPKIATIDFVLTTDSKGGAKPLVTGIKVTPGKLEFLKHLQALFPKAS